MCYLYYFILHFKSALQMGSSKSKPEDNSGVSDTSTGFHIVEIHTQSMGVSIFTFLVVILIFFLIYKCLRKFCWNFNLIAQAHANNATTGTFARMNSVRFRDLLNRVENLERPAITAANASANGNIV